MSIIEEMGAALDIRMIGDLAGPAVFGRGIGCWEDRRVESVVEEHGRLHATARGTRPYRVELWFEDDELRWACSCPAAEDSSFCKHGTAVALSLLYADEITDGIEAPGLYQEVDQSADADGDGELLGEFVRRLSPERLAEIVLSQSAADWALRERLLLEARAEQGLGRDMVQWRARIDEDGSLMVIGEQLAHLHYRACEQGSPDPVKLARRLAKLELNYELEAFCRSAMLYGRLLGPVGLATFRAAVEPAWLNVDPSDSRWRARDYRAREAMIGWALATGDPDALVEAHRRERIGAGGTLEIARAYERKVSKNYYIAVKHISRIRRLASEAGEPELFDTLLHHVRTAHKAKRRLQSDLGDMAPLADTSVVGTPTSSI